MSSPKSPDTGLLTDLLDRHVPFDSEETESLKQLRDWARTLPSPFSRHQAGAHFTGSALLVEAGGERVCLLHHRKLNRWLQPGGHAEIEDGGDLIATALREAREETGCEAHLHPTAPRPLDVNAHLIPAYGDFQEHYHLDVRFLAIAPPGAAIAHDPNESLGAGWFTWEEAAALTDEPGLLRMFDKARRAVNAPLSQ